MEKWIGREDFFFSKIYKDRQVAVAKYVCAMLIIRCLLDTTMIYGEMKEREDTCHLLDDVKARCQEV